MKIHDTGDHRALSPEQTIGTKVAKVWPGFGGEIWKSGP